MSNLNAAEPAHTTIIVEGMPTWFSRFEFSVIDQSFQWLANLLGFVRDSKDFHVKYWGMGYVVIIKMTAPGAYCVRLGTARELPIEVNLPLTNPDEIEKLEHSTLRRNLIEIMREKPTAQEIDALPLVGGTNGLVSVELVDLPPWCAEAVKGRASVSADLILQMWKINEVLKERAKAKEQGKRDASNQAGRCALCGIVYDNPVKSDGTGRICPTRGVAKDGGVPFGEQDMVITGDLHVGGKITSGNVLS